MKHIKYITRQMALQLGLRFYIGETPCKCCGYKRPVRYTSSGNCCSGQAKWAKAWREGK